MIRVYIALAAPAIYSLQNTLAVFMTIMLWRRRFGLHLQEDNRTTLYETNVQIDFVLSTGQKFV